MRKIVIGLTAAGLLLTAIPAFAQVGVEIGPGGIGVGVGRDRDRDYRRDRVYDGRGDRFERRRSCRTIVEERTTRSGRVVRTRTRIC
jgi:hypothetical protein